jgi:hypothetical protein
MTIKRNISWLTGPQVDERYSISPMTRHRWQRNGALNFPAAMKINRRCFWSLDALQTWERGKQPPSPQA